jgi:hypothetical protein
MSDGGTPEGEKSAALRLPAGTPAGWYADPLGVGAARYWDGTRWSNRHRDAPGPDPVPSPQPQSTQPPPPNPAPTSPEPSSSLRQRWKRLPKGAKIGIWVVIALVLIGIANSGGKSGSSSTSTSSSAAPAAKSSTTTPVKPATPSVPKSEKEARTWIKEHGTDAKRVAVNIEVVEISVGELQKESSETKLDEVAAQAQKAHNNLDEIRNEFATTEFSGEVEKGALQVFTSANGLKNAMGALVAYTGTPNAASLAHFTTQYEPAKEEWNEGIKTIYGLAHEKEAPTI